MKIIAHRGANREALENTQAAFAIAVQAGANRIEMDVQSTRDGEPIIWHDRCFRDEHGRRIDLSRMERQELAQAKLANGAPLLTLEETLDEFLPQIEINLEFKTCDPRSLQKTASLVSKSAYRDKVVLSSFHVQPLQFFCEHIPDVPRACLWGMDTLTWPAVSLFSPQIFMERCRATIFHPVSYWVDQLMMEQARHYGWQVYSWSEMNGEEQDREAVWSALTAFGVDGHCTNYPRQLRCWLQDVEEDLRMLKETPIKEALHE